MPNHIDLPTAKRLAEGVRCPTCGGNGWNSHRPAPPQVLAVTTLADCTTCDGTGLLFFKGEWPQLVWALEPVHGWRTVWLARDADWHPDHRYPAPHPVDVLLWLEEIRVIEWQYGGGTSWSARVSPTHEVYADAPEALLTAVLSSA